MAVSAMSESSNPLHPGRSLGHQLNALHHPCHTDSRSLRAEVWHAWRGAAARAVSPARLINDPRHR